ncbi:MAG: GumC family protein, partial [Fidelibacterota bacterium]
MTQYELNFNDYWRIIKKKKWLIIFTAVMLTFFSLLFTIINKPTPIYEATSSIQIEKNTSLTGLYMESVSWSYGGDLATRAAVLKSYNMIEKAAKDLGLIDSNLTSEEIKQNKKYFNIIEGLKSRVTTEQEGHTNIININVKSHQPELARDLANSLARTYQRENYIQKNAKTNNAINALKQQLKNAEEDYQATEMELQKFRQKNKFLTLLGKSNTLSENILKKEKKIEELSSDIQNINQAIKKLRLDERYLQYLSLNLLLYNKNNVLASLQTNLDKYNRQLDELQQYYTTEHPKVKNLIVQTDVLKKNIIEELVSFQQTLQEIRLQETQKLEQLNREYNALPALSQEIENLQRELETSRNIYEKLKVNYLQSMVKKTENIQEVFLIRPAFLPNNPINSIRLTPTGLAGLIIGIIFGIILAFIAETLDTTFRTIDDIEQTLGTTVQGIIPFIDASDLKSTLYSDEEEDISPETIQNRARLMTHFAPKSTIAESYRSLRTNINFSLMEKNYKTILVTSSVAGEGKTTTATNLALSMAQTGLRTLLVEADLRKPRVSKTLGIERVPGLTDYILNREPLEGCIRDMSDLLMGSLGQDTMKEDAIPGIEYLNILPAGKIERNPSEIIAGKKLDTLIKTVREQYDIVIFDSAPIIQATDTVVLASKVDTNLIVYYQGKISRHTLRRAKNQLELIKSSVLGIVINGMRADISSDYVDYKYRYDYLYSYGDHDQLEETGWLSKIKAVFIKPETNIHHTFISRFKKLPVFFVIALIFLFGLIGLYRINASKNEKSEELQTVKSPSPPASVNQTQTSPEKLKELQEQHNIIPDEEPA